MPQLTPSWTDRLGAPVRIMRQRPRLAISIVAGAGATAAMPQAWGMPLRLLLGWDFGVALYLVLAFTLMSTGGVSHARRAAARQDEGRLAILALTVAAALASLAAIVIELGGGRSHAPFHLALATVTIVLSWAFTHTIFALHYAHEYYHRGTGACGGLAFPGNDEPDYWDFMYFSFVIGMTSQVSDVGVTSRGIRRTVAAHGVVSFFFNVSLLALMVNIAAGAI